MKTVEKMKKNAPKFVDDTHVQVTKEFAKNARIFGTAEYKLWKAIKADCIVGSVADGNDVKLCVEAAYSCFYPAQYISENLCADDDRYRILYLARDAYEIDRALELAMSA